MLHQRLSSRNALCGKSVGLTRAPIPMLISQVPTNMKDLGTTIKCLGKARFILPVVQCIKAIGFATSLMVKGCTHGLTAAGMS